MRPTGTPRSSFFSAGVLLACGQMFAHNFRSRYYDRMNLDDYPLVDSRLNFRPDGLTIFAEAKNIFDVEYREANLVAMPGRWVFLMFSGNDEAAFIFEVSERHSDISRIKCILRKNPLCPVLKLIENGTDMK